MSSGGRRPGSVGLFRTVEFGVAWLVVLLTLAGALLMWSASDAGDVVDWLTAATGLLTAGFGLAATVLFVGALRLQARELQLQREELQETRAVHRAQQGALEQQARLLEAQRLIARRVEAREQLFSLAAQLRELTIRHGVAMRRSEAEAAAVRTQMELMVPLITGYLEDATFVLPAPEMERIRRSLPSASD